MSIPDRLRTEEYRLRTVVGVPVLLVLVVSVAVAGVQVYGDRSTPAPPSVDTSESPREVANDAWRNMWLSSHTRNVTVFHRGNGEVERVTYSVLADPADKQIRKVYRRGPHSEITEGEGTYVWENGKAFDYYGEWQRAERETGFVESYVPDEPLVGADTPVEVASENDSTLVLRFTLREGQDVPADDADGSAPTVRMFVDKRDGRLVRLVVGNDPVKVVWEFGRYGSTDVERPPGLGSWTIDELLYDVRHGPLYG